MNLHPPNLRPSLGDHTIIDMWEPALSGSPADIGPQMERAMLHAATEAKMTILMHGSHMAANGSVVAHVVISESHIMAVYQPNTKMMFIDVFTCGGENFDKNEAAQAVLLQAFTPAKHATRSLQRGLLDIVLPQAVGA